MGSINVDGKDYIIGAVGNVESAIEWLEGAVCYAGGRQWHFNDSVKPYKLVNNMQGTRLESYVGVINMSDFKLNTIKQGDYIEASELDTKQKYNDVVEVFELFGFAWGEDAVDSHNDVISMGSLTICHDGIFATEVTPKWCARKLTYQQVMAIGELKRLEIERDKKSTPKVSRQSCAEYYETHNVDGTLKASIRKSNNSEKPNSSDAVNKPSHYQFFEGVEVIEIIASSMTREQFKGYCLGNRIKYRLRAGNKDKLEQEIAKSDKYVELYDEHKHLCK